MNGTNEGGHPETMLVAIPSSNVIPGLECLLPLSQIFVRQQIDVLEGKPISGMYMIIEYKVLPLFAIE